MNTNILTTAFIGLGANLGNTVLTLQSAIQDLNKIPTIKTVAVSSFYSSKPVAADGPDYTNAVIQIETVLSAHDLLKITQNIENTYGRTRLYHNAPRTLDLDILLFGNSEINTDDLVIPHPRMHIRSFVLLPLLEIAPKLKLPQGNTIDLINAVKDQIIYKLN